MWGTYLCPPRFIPHFIHNPHCVTGIIFCAILMAMAPSPPPEESHPTGAAVIQAALPTLPASPGVYRMLDHEGTALYVGKAKMLPARVASYAQRSGLSYRIQRMVSQVAKVEITTTASEAEALLLEANLIKKLKPRYNILLRDDKSFPYIRITGHDFPRIEKYRGRKEKDGEYFGPFASTGAVNDTLTLLQKAFLLRPCADSVFHNRHRPCLQFQIKRCSAPCVGRIEQEQYGALVEEARAFLSGKSRAVQEALAERMEEASEAMDYERAAMLRDRIRALTTVQNQAALQDFGVSDADVIALHRSGSQACVQILFLRGGQHYGNRAYFPVFGPEDEDSAILSAFIGQFYQSRLPPRQLLLSHEPEEKEALENALALLAEEKIHLLTPQRGGKKRAVDLAARYAGESLARRQAEHGQQQKLFAAVGELFGCESPPQRIEVYDNSHIQGQHAIGAMIAATPEGFDKKSYRTFNMKKKEDGALPPPQRGSQTDPVRGGDDYAYLRETLTRRLTPLQRADEATGGPPRPDLLLIDGGAGHLGIVREVMEELGISDLPYVCIAKGPDRHAGREWFHQPDTRPFQLPPDDARLHFLQRLRDEAHRFAIGTHRNKRSRAIRDSGLEAVPGVGAARKKALLHHFGSARAVKEATPEQLAAVPGISPRAAQGIHNFFRGDGNG